MAPEDLLKNIAKILDKLKIPYAITGGFAVSVWGRIRSTLDIDIIVEMSDKNVKPLVIKVRKLVENAYADEDAVREALLHKSEFNFIDPDSGMKVDFFVQADNPYNKLKIKRRVSKDIFGAKVYFVSPEDLILSKLLWSKESSSWKQREDVKTILAKQKGKLDLNYLNSWATKHDTIEILNDLLKMK
jgi:hypothetical protein